MSADDGSKPGILSRVAATFGRRKDSPLLTQATRRKPLGDDPASMSSTIPFDWGSSAGWLDSNDQFTPEYLHGDYKTPGKLLEIRRTDDVIAPAVDSRREMMASFEYEVRPRYRFRRDERAIKVAIGVAARLDSMPGTSVPWLMSEMYDHWFTSGINVDEIQLDWCNRLHLLHIRPGLIRWFNQDETGRGFKSIRVRTKFSDATIEARKISYMARNAEPGEFWGESGCRCLIATSETTLQLYTALLQSIRYSMGFPYLSESDASGLLTDADKTNGMKSLSNVLGGRSDLAFFGKKLKPEILSSQTPAMQQFGPLAQHQAERKQAAAKNSLSNLGMRGVGSRSLGETIQDADMRAVKGHLDLYMKTVSGDNQMSGSLMRTLTELEGEHPDLAPEIVIRWDNGAERKGLDHLKFVADLVRDGITPMSPELGEWFANQTQTPRPETSGADDVVAGVEPLAVGSLQASIQVLNSLNPTDPAIGRIAPGAALQILMGAGVSPESAQAMIDAQLAMVPR